MWELKKKNTPDGTGTVSTTVTLRRKNKFHSYISVSFELGLFFNFLFLDEEHNLKFEGDKHRRGGEWFLTEAWSLHALSFTL